MPNFRNPPLQTFISGPKDLLNLRNSLWIQKIFILCLSDCFYSLKILYRYTFPSFAFTEMESSHARTLHMEMKSKSMETLFRRLARLQSMLKSHDRAV